MEDFKRDLKLGELKRENLRKSLEQAKAQVSSILVFTFHVQELENHFDLVQQNIEKGLAVLESRQRELDTTVTTLREKQEEIGLKENELSLLSKKIEECNVELKFKEQDVEWMQHWLQDCSSDCKLKGEELDSIRKSIEDRSRELSSKNEELCCKQEEITLKESQLSLLSKKIVSLSKCCEELEVKKKQLSPVEEELRKLSEEIDASKVELESLWKSIEECSNQLDTNRIKLVGQFNELSENEKMLESIKSLIQDYEEELEAKKEKYEALEKSIGAHAAKLDYKEKELGLIKGNISDCLRELDSKNDNLDSLLKSIRRKGKQLESAKKELDSKENSIRGYSKDIELKSQKFDALQMSIEECNRELHFKEKQLRSVQVSIEGSTKQLRAKEEKLTSIKDSILECTKELKSKQQQLQAIQKSQVEISGVIESKEKQLNSVKKEFGERLQEADAKEKRLSSLERSLHECLEKFETEKRQFESKEKQLISVKKECGERLQEADVKEKRLSSLERSLAERSEKLETENREFEARVKEFELREKQFDSVQKTVEHRSKELELREKELTEHLHSQVSNENLSYFFAQALGITNTESVNPVIPNQIKTETPDHFTTFNATETSSADLVVDAAMGMDLQSIRNVHLNEPDLRKNEVLSALQMSPDPAKFVLDVMQGVSSEHKKKGGTGFEESVLEISLLMLEQLLQVSPHVQPKVKADALELAKEWIAEMKPNAVNSIEMLGFLQFVAAFGLASTFNRDEIFKLLETTAQHQQARNVCRVLGVTDMIPEFVSSLIARKQYIEAVRFVCAFDCKDKFPPQHLLNLFFYDIRRVACGMIGKNLPEAQQNATDEQIAALKSIIECVKDCKLESCVSVEVFGQCIAELENLKMNRTFSAPAHAPAVQPNVHSWTTYYTGTSVPKNQPSHVPAVQGQFEGGIYPFTQGTQRQGQFHGGIYASTPGTQPQEQFQQMINASIPRAQPKGLSNKRARADGLVINSYTPQVATVVPNICPTSLHGSGVPNPRNQGATHFGLAANKEPSSTSATRQSNAAERNYPIHNRPKQQ